jgi:uncharacterized protein YrzB (UPF0473 family)
MSKYRVGRKQGRAILFTETGEEYLVFPIGSEEACKQYCDYLNNKSYSKEEVLALLNKLNDEGPGYQHDWYFEPIDDEESIKANEESFNKWLTENLK